MGWFRRSRASDPVEASDDADPAHEAAVHAGVPGRCPVCDGFGYIDNIDLRNRIQSQHCRACRHVWEFSFDDEGVVIDLRDPAPVDAETTPVDGSDSATR